MYYQVYRILSRVRIESLKILKQVQHDHPLLCHPEAFFAEGSPYFEEVNRPSSILHQRQEKDKEKGKKEEIPHFVRNDKGRDAETSACLARKRLRDDSLFSTPCHPEFISGSKYLPVERFRNNHETILKQVQDRFYMKLNVLSHKNLFKKLLKRVQRIPLLVLFSSLRAKVMSVAI